MKVKLNSIIKNERILLIFLAITAFGCLYKLLLPGFYEPHDLHHLADIYEMYRAITSGQFPSRWGPDFLYGFGYPLFNFYYIAPFYLGAFIYFLSGSLMFSYEMIFILGTLLGTIGFYLFLRKHFSPIASFSASVLFTYTPYKAVQVYVRGAMGEFFSLSLMPWFLYFFQKHVEKGEKKWFFWATITASLIVLSHNYFWVLIFGFMGLYYLYGSFAEKNFKNLFIFLCTIIFSLAISAFWWLPAFVEQNLLTSQTPFPLIDHFLFIKQLIIPSWGFGASLWGPYDGISFQLGVVNIFVIAVSFAIILFGYKGVSRIGIWAAESLLLCLFFMNIRSYFIWKIVPFHDFFQFPWRLLAFTGFFSAVLAAFVIDYFLNKKKRLLAEGTAIVIALFSIILTISYFKPSQIFYKSDDDYLRRMFADRLSGGKKDRVDGEYLTYSEDYLLLPKWVENKPDLLPKEKFVSKTPGSVVVKDIREYSPVFWEADVDVDDFGQLDFYALYFPGWKVTVDGRRSDIYPGDHGQIVMDLKTGDRKIIVKWTETNLRKISDAISLSAFFALVVFSFGIKGKNNEKQI